MSFAKDNLPGSTQSVDIIAILTQAARSVTVQLEADRSSHGCRVAFIHKKSDGDAPESTFPATPATWMLRLRCERSWHPKNQARVNAETTGIDISDNSHNTGSSSRVKVTKDTFFTDKHSRAFQTLMANSLSENDIEALRSQILPDMFQSAQSACWLRELPLPYMMHDKMTVCFDWWEDKATSRSIEGVQSSKGLDPPLPDPNQAIDGESLIQPTQQSWTETGLEDLFMTITFVLKASVTKRYVLVAENLLLITPEQDLRAAIEWGKKEGERTIIAGCE